MSIQLKKNLCLLRCCVNRFRPIYYTNNYIKLLRTNFTWKRWRFCAAAAFAASMTETSNPSLKYKNIVSSSFAETRNLSLNYLFVTIFSKNRAILVQNLGKEKNVKIRFRLFKKIASMKKVSKRERKDRVRIKVDKIITL